MNKKVIAFVRLLVSATMVCMLFYHVHIPAGASGYGNSYKTGVLTQGGYEYTYTTTLNGGTTGMRTSITTEATVKRTHYAVTAVFKQNGLNVTGKSVKQSFSAMKGTSHSTYARPGSLAGITSVISASGQVYIEKAGTFTLSFKGA